MKTTQRGPVITVTFGVRSGWEQWFLLRSDAHHDSVHCNRDLETKHLKKALERNAIILDGGDLFDAMQGKFDPRRSYDDIRPEYLKENKYYTNILNDLIDYYKPYANNFLLMARGNHESSVIKNAHHDLTGSLVDALNRETGSNIIAGHYGGYVRLLTMKPGGKAGGGYNLKYFHGAGAEAPVTRGVIQTNRQAVYLPNADIVWNGHNHNDYIIDIKRECVTSSGNIFFDILTFVRTPGYKDDYGQGTNGWSVEGGGVPKPHGAAWLKLYWFNDKLCKEIYLDVE